MTGWAEWIAGERLQQVCSADLDLGGAGIVCPLDNFGVLKISGEDAEDFLHNQASNDLRAFSPGSPRGPGNPGEPGGPLIENEV